MEEKKEPGELCSNCQAPINNDTSIDGDQVARPRPNDLSICMFCGQPYYFGEQLQRIPISKELYNRMPHHAKQQLKDAWKIRAELLRTAMQQGSKFDQ